MEKQTIHERLADILYSYRIDLYIKEEAAIGAICDVVIESLPGEKTFISEHPKNTTAQIKEMEQEAFTLGHNACLSSIKQSWEPIKAQIMNHLPPIKSKHIGCLCCPGNESCLPMDTTLYNGFGGWIIARDGELWFSENSETEWEDSKKLQDIEIAAQDSPDHDWRAILNAPLRGAVYQRQNGKWLLIEENEGFA